MKLRKWTAGLLAAVILGCGGLCAAAEGEENRWTGEDYTFAVPAEIAYTFTPATSQEDPSWTLAGIAAPAEKLREYEEMNLAADFYTEAGAAGPSVKLQVKTNSSMESLFSLRDFSQEDRDEFLAGLINSQSDSITVEKSYIDVDGQPFYRVKIDGEYNEAPVHEIQYGTIVNGHNLAFLMYGGEKEITQEELALLESMVTSVKFTELLTKPEPEPMSGVLVLGVLALLVIVVVAPLVYTPIQNRREKRKKAELAQRLETFQETHRGDSLYGEVLFVNETECTREAIHTFSVYHAYGKNLLPLLVGVAICAVLLAVAFLLDATWWIKTLSVGAAVYYAYKAVSMSSTVEKAQRKVFQRGVTTTARYSFYEDGFRVSGIQSASVFPYFQISSVNRHSHYLYLYYGPDNVYMVDQYGFTQGSFEDFTDFIEKKIKE